MAGLAVKALFDSGVCGVYKKLETSGKSVHQRTVLNDKDVQLDEDAASRFHAAALKKEFKPAKNGLVLRIEGESSSSSSGSGQPCVPVISSAGSRTSLDDTGSGPIVAPADIDDFGMSIPIFFAKAGSGKAASSSSTTAAVATPKAKGAALGGRNKRAVAEDTTTMDATMASAKVRKIEEAVANKPSGSGTPDDLRLRGGQGRKSAAELQEIDEHWLSQVVAQIAPYKNVAPSDETYLQYMADHLKKVTASKLEVVSKKRAALRRNTTDDDFMEQVTAVEVVLSNFAKLLKDLTAATPPGSVVADCIDHAQTNGFQFNSVVYTRALRGLFSDDLKFARWGDIMSVTYPVAERALGGEGATKLTKVQIGQLLQKLLRNIPLPKACFLKYCFVACCYMLLVLFKSDSLFN
jgi:hypothetical protein